MTQILEERKQQFRNELKQSLIPFKKKHFSWGSQPGISYESTWSIANTPPYFQSNREVFIVRNNPWHGLGGIFIFIIVFCAIFFAKAYNNAFAMAFLLVFVWIGIKMIVKALDKKPKLTIDSRGILYYEWMGFIGWKDIISTYILERKNEDDNTRNLLIYFHDTEDDTIKQKLVTLDGLRTDIIEVSFFVEYIKLKAGFPTEPLHY